LQSGPSFPIFVGQVPKRIIIGFVGRDAYMGNLKASPFEFKDCGITEMKIRINNKVCGKFINLFLFPGCAGSPPVYGQRKTVFEYAVHGAHAVARHDTKEQWPNVDEERMG
jgi:hypothetical protein